MLFQFLHLNGGTLVIHLKDSDKVRDGEHAHELLLLWVPQGSSSHPIIHQGKEGLLHQELRVKHHQLGRRWDEIIALVKSEEFDKDLVLVASCNGIHREIRISRPWFQREIRIRPRTKCGWTSWRGTRRIGQGASRHPDWLHPLVVIFMKINNIEGTKLAPCTQNWTLSPTYGAWGGIGPALGRTGFQWASRLDHTLDTSLNIICIVMPNPYPLCGNSFLSREIQRDQLEGCVSSIDKLSWIQRTMRTCMFALDR